MHPALLAFIIIFSIFSMLISWWNCYWTCKSIKELHNAEDALREINRLNKETNRLNEETFQSIIKTYESKQTQSIV